MRIDRSDRHLKLFENFSGSPTLERNAVRALFTTLSLSGPSAALTRPLLTLVQQQLDSARLPFSHPERIRDLLSRWPERMAFSLEERADAVKDKFKNTVLICLVPSLRLDETYHSIYDVLEKERDAPIQEPGAERPDASIRLWLEQPEDSPEHQHGHPDLTLYFEAKLRSAVPINQISTYLNFIRSRLEKDGAYAVLPVTWESIHRAFRQEISLTTETETYPLIVNEFMDYVRQRPHLRFFYGLQASDFGKDGISWQDFDGLAGEVHKLADKRLAEKYSATAEDSDSEYEGYLYPWESSTSRAFDYDFRGRDTGGYGNTGLAHWSNGAISAKLVVGAKSRYEIDWLMSWLGKPDQRESLAEALKHIGKVPTNGGIKASLLCRVRVFWSRFREDFLDIAGFNLAECDPVEMIDDLSKALENVHGKGVIEGELKETVSRLALQPLGDRRICDLERNTRTLELVDESYEEAAPPKAFAYIFVRIDHEPMWFEKRYLNKSEEPFRKQVNELAEEIVGLENVLRRLAGLPVD